MLDHFIDCIRAVRLWLVDGEITSKNILLAVDGSINSVKAMNYLCDILRPDPDALLTLFHVQPSLRDFCDIDFTEPGGRAVGLGYH